MRKPKSGDKVRIIGPSISGYKDSIGLEVTLKHNPDPMNHVFIPEMERGSYTHINDLELIRDMENLQLGDVLVNEDGLCDYERIVEDFTSVKGKKYIVTRDTDDDKVRINTQEWMEDSGWKLKTEEELTEVTLDDIAKAMNVDVKNLRIKE